MAALSRETEGALGYVNHLSRNLPHRASPMIVTAVKPFPLPRTLALKKKVNSFVPGLDTKKNFLAVRLLQGKTAPLREVIKGPAHGDLGSQEVGGRGEGEQAQSHREGSSG